MDVLELSPGEPTRNLLKLAREGLIAAALSVSLGLIVGALAGFYGGWIDDVMALTAKLKRNRLIDSLS